MSQEEINALLAMLAPVQQGGSYQLEAGEITQINPPTQPNLAGAAPG